MANKFEQRRLFEDELGHELEVVPDLNQTPSPNSKSTIMPISTADVSSAESKRVIHFEEGQFGEVKAIDIKPADLTKTISAFANADGGDLYIGVDETGQTKVRSWRGFTNQEAANGHIQCFEGLFPLGRDYAYEFLICDGLPGIVLHVQVNKTRAIAYATNRLAYVRRGAQNLPQDSPDKIKRLEYSKGIAAR